MSKIQRRCGLWQPAKPQHRRTIKAQQLNGASQRLPDRSPTAEIPKKIIICGPGIDWETANG